jgi:hypothetical protein
MIVRKQLSLNLTELEGAARVPRVSPSKMAAAAAVLVSNELQRERDEDAEVVEEGAIRNQNES